MSLRRTCCLVGVAVALWCAPGAWARAATGARTTADEPQYLLSAISLAEDRSLDISDERSDGRYRDFHAAGLPLQEEIRADGSRVSPHDPLLPALLAVPVAAGGWLVAKLVLAAVAGTLAALLVWLAEVRFGVRRRVAVVVVLAFASSAPFAVYATQVYPELPAALVVTLALALVTGPPPLGGFAARRDALALVVLTSCLVWLSVKYAPIGVAFGTAGILRSRARTVLVVAGLASAAIFAILHMRWYGGFTPYAAGAHFGDGQLAVLGDRPDYPARSVRVAGLIVDRDFGLAAWQPAYLLALPAVGAFVRCRPGGWLPVTLVLIAGWLNAAFLALTMHGWWFPGRQVVVVLPCVVLLVAWWCARVGPRAAALLAALGALGASLYAWLVLQSFTTDLRIVTTFAELAHPWWRALGVVLPDGRGDRPIDGLLLAAWAAIAVAAITLGWRRAGARASIDDGCRASSASDTSDKTRAPHRALVTT